MKKQESLKWWFIAIVLIAFVAVSAVVSKAQIEGPVSVAPIVTATYPADGATVVSLNQAIAVTFSQPMSAASIVANLILLAPDGNRVAGEVNFHGTTAVFRPTINLMPNTTYIA